MCCVRIDALHGCARFADVPLLVFVCPAALAHAAVSVRVVALVSGRAVVLGVVHTAVLSDIHGVVLAVVLVVVRAVVCDIVLGIVIIDALYAARVVAITRRVVLSVALIGVFRVTVLVIGHSVALRGALLGARLLVLIGVMLVLLIGDARWYCCQCSWCPSCQTRYSHSRSL